MSLFHHMEWRNLTKQFEVPGIHFGPMLLKENSDWPKKSTLITDAIHGVELTSLFRRGNFLQEHCGVQQLLDKAIAGNTPEIYLRSCTHFSANKLLVGIRSDKTCNWRGHFFCSNTAEAWLNLSLYVVYIPR